MEVFCVSLLILPRFSQLKGLFGVGFLILLRFFELSVFNIGFGGAAKPWFSHGGLWDANIRLLRL